MTTWTNDEPTKIGDANELELATRRADGTPRPPVTIWVLRSGDELYVRSWRGRGGAWFRRLAERPEGRITAGGVDRDVAFAGEPGPAVNDRIDAAYRAKYRRYPTYVEPMVAPAARATTLRLVPRAVDEGRPARV